MERREGAVPGRGGCGTGSGGGGGESRRDKEEDTAEGGRKLHHPERGPAVTGLCVRPWVPRAGPRQRRETSGHHGRGGGCKELAHATPSRDGADPGTDPVLPGNSAGPRLPSVLICQRSRKSGLLCKIS